MKFEQFQASIQKIGNEINKAKIGDINKRLTDVNKEIARKERDLKRNYEVRKKKEEEERQIEMKLLLE